MDEHYNRFTLVELVQRESAPSTSSFLTLLSISYSNKILVVIAEISTAHIRLCPIVPKTTASPALGQHATFCMSPPDTCFLPIEIIVHLFVKKVFQ